MGLPRFTASVGHVPESGERVRQASPVSGLPVQVIRVPVSLLSLAMITEDAVDIGQPLDDVSLGAPIAGLLVQFAGLAEGVPCTGVLPAGVGDEPQACQGGGLAVPVPGPSCCGVQILIEQARLI